MPEGVLVVHEDLFQRVLELAHELRQLHRGDCWVGDEPIGDVLQPVDSVKQNLQRKEAYFRQILVICDFGTPVGGCPERSKSTVLGE